MFTLIFDLIDGAQIRTTTLDGVTMFSGLDFVAGACNLSPAGAKREFKKMEKGAGARQARFPGVGQRDTPVLTVLGLERLLAELGDRVAQGKARQIEEGLRRLKNGDSSSIKCSGSVRGAGSPKSGERSAGVGKKRLAESGLESEQTQMDLEERRNRINALALSNTQTMLEILERLKPGNAVDEYTAELISEQTKAILLGGLCRPDYGGSEGSEDCGGSVMSEATVSEPEEDQGIRISSVAKELKINCTEGQLKEIGKRMAIKYKEEHLSPPPKQMRRVGSRAVYVNTYTEKDRGMMEVVIAEYFQE
jgi:hypothetical protein